MENTWIVTIPPLLVITCVLLTRHMIFSFLVGIISGALIVTNGNPVQTVILCLKRLWNSTGLENLSSPASFWTSWNLLIFLFLIIIGVLIVLLSESGAALAYAKVMGDKVKSKKGVEISSLILSLFFFIDDYFSALTVGSVMRPLAEKYGVSSLKLAFLTTTMASPLVILSPISSWVGQILGQLKETGIGPESTGTLIVADPYLVLMQSIPFILYASLLVVSTWYIVLRRISYGPMEKVENSTQSVSISHENLPTSHATLFDFVLPLIVLVSVVIGMLLYTGNFYLFGGTNNLLESIKNSVVQQALFIGGLTSLVVSFAYFIARGLITSKNIFPVMKNGFDLMLPSIIMLICAWSLGTIIKDDLQTGSYVGSVIESFINIQFFPVLCFIFATLIASMIGSAWATIALMMPIIVDLLQKLLHIVPHTNIDTIPMLFPIIGALLSGCILGTQISLISDNPIMSSASTGANHLEHIKTMAWYVIPVGIVSALCFIFLGFAVPLLGLFKSALCAFIAGSLLAFASLETAQYFFSKR